MKILGIIAEYDPLHRGHEYQLRRAKELVRPDFTFIAISGCVKQRGELSLLDPYDRAACALECGADAVFALPTAWTVRDAEHYALGAVHLLYSLGVTHLAFGAETGSLDRLQEIAETLEHPEEAFRDHLRQGLTQGVGFPLAVNRALAGKKTDLAEIMNLPNNILAVHYLRAIQRLRIQMTPVVIPRIGGYYADRIDPESPSAAAVRGALYRGDYAHAAEALPEVTRERVQKAFLDRRIPDLKTLDQLMIRRLRGMIREEAARLPGVSEGLGERLREGAGHVVSREELLDYASGKRYPRARISRICAWAMLGMDVQTMLKLPLPKQGVMLGLRKNTEMTAFWREREIQVTTDWTEETDLQAWKLWAQCAGLPDTLPWTEKVISL